MILDEESSEGTITEVALSETPRSDGFSTPAAPGHSSDDGIPTENIPLTTGPIAASPRMLVAQAAVVVGVALLVGTIVFLTVLGVAGSDDDGDGVLVETSLIDPGPSGGVVGLDDSSRSGSRRDTPGDGLARVDEERTESESNADVDGQDDGERELGTPAAAVAAAADAVAEEVEAQEEAAAADPFPPTASSTVAQLAGVKPGGGLGSGPGGGELRPTTSTSQAASTTSVPPTATTVPSPTTSQTTGTLPVIPVATATTTTGSSSTTSTTSTTAPTSTVVATTVTTAPTIVITAPPPPLIAGPADGSIRQWETPTSFRAEAQPNATMYCWALISGAGQRQDCTPDLNFELPATPTGVLPGPILVKAKAIDGEGTLLAEGQISISLLVSEVASSPADAVDFVRADGITLTSFTVASATRYCWTVSQATSTTGEMCETGLTTTLAGDDARLDGIGLGTTRIRFTAYRGLDLIGNEVVMISFS